MTMQTSEGIATSSDDPILYNVFITAVGATDLPCIGGLLKLDPNALLKITVSQPRSLKIERKKYRTKTNRSTNPAWNQGFLIMDVNDQTELSLKVVAYFGKKQPLGIVKLSIGELLNKCSNAPDKAICTFSLGMGRLTICARREANDSSSIVEIFTELHKETDVLSLPVLSETGMTAYECLASVVKSLSKLMDIGDSFSQIHPYVHMAWKVASSIYKIINDQLNRDEKIIKLLGIMETMYSFVEALEHLRGSATLHKSVEDAVQSILKQTLECVLFLQEYSGHGFTGKLLRQTFDQFDQKIKQFEQAFISLAACFDTTMALQIHFISLRIDGKVDRLVLRDDLKPIEMDWSGRPKCHPNTRLGAIAEITDWITNFSVSGNQNVLWISGLAGSGKSTLSTTLANMYDDLGRLGAFLFFNRDVGEKSNPALVIRTLAYELAKFEGRLRRKIVDAVQSNPHVTQRGLDIQFLHLLKRPLASSAKELAKEGPLIIIIDALDECGTPEQRKELVTLLAEATSDFPPCIRIIITSRQALDIQLAFGKNCSHIHVMELHLSENDEIETYFKQQLSQIAWDNKLSSWPEVSQIAQLVERTAGLWIWASTACRFIGGYDYPEDGLEDLLSGSDFGLEDIYTKALTFPSGKSSGKVFHRDCCAILGVILVAKDPLSPSTIDQFLKSGDQRRPSQRIISQLKSVLHQKEEGLPVRILHTSFGDFLTNPSRKEDTWFIDLVEHNRRLAENCVKVLADVFVDNEKFHVDNFLGDMVQTDRGGDNSPRHSPTIDESLSYASTHWIAHVSDMQDCPGGFEGQLLDLLLVHFLHWLAVMSMLGRSRNTASSLLMLIEWIQINIRENVSLLQFLDDAHRFAAFFTDTIAEDPRLIYLSALPFAPVHSRIYQQFYRGRSDLPMVLGGYQERWSRSLRVFGRKDSRVHSVDVSPDDTKFATSGDDNGIFSVRIWSTMTAVELISPVSTDNSSVVMFSPNGDVIWAASSLGTIYTINVSTGEVTSQLGWSDWSHPDIEETVDTVSNKRNEAGRASFDKFSILGSNRRMSANNEAGKAQVKDDFSTLNPASNNSAKRTGMFYVESGSLLTDLVGSEVSQKKQSIVSSTQPSSFIRAAFHPQGRIVVFGAPNGELYVVDLAKRRIKYFPLKSPPLRDRDVSRMFRSVFFSPDGFKFASGSGNGCVYVWETESGICVHKLQGHTEEVTVVAFSRDSETLVTGAEDGTVRIWGAENGELLRKVDIGKMDGLQPLGIAPGTDRLISTSKDGTLQVWNISVDKDINPIELQGHFNAVSALAFSLDGSRLISSAFINDIQLWDITAGDSVLQHAKIQRHERPPHEVKFSPNGLVVMSSRRAPDCKKFWDSRTGRELKTVPYDLAAHFHTFSEDDDSDIEEPSQRVYSSETSTSFDSDQSTNDNDSRSQFNASSSSSSDDDEEDETNDIINPDEEIQEEKKPVYEVLSKSGDLLPLFDAETNKLWRFPRHADGDELAMSLRAESGSKNAEIGPGGIWFTRIGCTDEGMVVKYMVQGDIKQRRLLWRVPMEFKHRSHDCRGNFIAIGMWDGRVIVVHLSDNVVSV